MAWKKEQLQEVKEFLASIPALQNLLPSAPDKLLEIAHALVLKRFGAGNVIVQEGEEGAGFYFIWEGQVVVSPTQNILEPGNFFGTVRFDKQQVMPATVIARSEVTCLILQHENIYLLFPSYVQRPKQALVETALELEKIEDDIWRAHTPALDGGRLRPAGERGFVFGGQFVSQALAAAIKTVDASLLVHSLHSYFLSFGDDILPIVYQVDRIRDGKTFATRNVTAIQRGRSVFILVASFQKQEENIVQYQEESMPEAPDPNQLKSEEQLIMSQIGDPRLPLHFREGLTKYPVKIHPLDVRPCDPNNEVNPQNLEPRQTMWLKSKQTLSEGQALHRCVAAYASDWMIVPTILRPYQAKLRKEDYRLLSLDHSVWFHKDIKADEWLLFKITSPRASGSRGLVIGHMFNRSGELVVTVVQQGLARVNSKL